jgi:uncharacterized protein YjhX (UPF0386 family)
MKKNKILIIGFGNMGLSHYKSFIKKDFIIHIVEKSINEKIKNVKKNKLFNKKIFVFQKLPYKQKYLLTISSTPSKIRFALIKKFFETNQTKFLLLEKFCFFSISQFNEFKKKMDHQTKTFINSWGYILAKKSALKSKLKKFKVVCYVKEGNLLANITHLFHFFNYLNNKKSIKSFSDSNSKIIKNITRKSYDELSATIKVEDIDKNEMIIQTKKKMNDLITFFVIQKYPNINFKLSIKKNNTIHFYRFGIKKEEITFPFSSKTSYIFLTKLIKNNFNFMPSFENDYELSKMLLRKLKVKIP